MTDASQVAALDGIVATPAPERTGLQARSYTHPAFEGRTVVRLVQENLGEVEDLSLGALGFTPAGHTDCGFVCSRAVGFPAWPIINDPKNARHALNLVGDLQRAAKQARSRPGNAKVLLDRLAKMLGDSAPHFLPTFLEEAARIFLRHDNRAYAAQYFGKAREAERVHNLQIDEERHRQVLLEFALVGALTAKELSIESKTLLERYEPPRALDSFIKLNVERVKGGLPPYGGLATDLRRLAKAAGATPREVETRLLREIINSPALGKAPAAFWKGIKSSLVPLAKEEPKVKEALLALAPETVAADDWIELLDAVGATKELLEGRADARSWLERYTRMLQSAWNQGYPRKLSLLARHLPSLKGQQITLRPFLYRLQPELLDAVLEAGAKVSFEESPYARAQLRLNDWLQSQDRPDLSFLAASEHARLALESAGDLAEDHLDTLLAHPGSRELLSKWNESRLGEHPTIVEVRGECQRLRPLLSPQGRAAFPRQLADLTKHLDASTLLAQVLRDGFLTEYTWPALEAAAAELEGQVNFHESFPAVGAAANGHIIWVDGQQRVAEAAFTVKNPKSPEDWCYLLVDGATACASSNTSWDRYLHWSTAPGQEHELGYFYNRLKDALTLAVPEGRLVGAHLVRPGDTENPFSNRSGVFQEDGHYWSAEYESVREVDPDTGTKGRESLPGPLAELVEPYLREGWEMLAQDTTWCQETQTTSASCFSTAAGRHAWVKLRRGDENLYLDADGQAIRSECRVLVGRLRRPGGGSWLVSTDRLRRETDQAPLLTAAGADGCEHLLHSLPWAGWHQLQVRDAAVSARLREATPVQAATLLEAVPAAKYPQHGNDYDESTLEDTSLVLTDAARAAATKLLGSSDAALVDAVVWAAARVKRIVADAQAQEDEGTEAGRSFPWEASTNLIRWATTAWGGSTDRDEVQAIARRLAGEAEDLDSVAFTLSYVLTHPLALLHSATRPLATKELVGKAAAAFGDVVDAGIYSPTCCVFDVAGLDGTMPSRVTARVVETGSGPAVMIGRNTPYWSRDHTARFYSPSGAAPTQVDGHPVEVALRGCGHEAQTLMEAFRLLLEQGGPAWDPQKAARLAEGTGWDLAAASLLLAGLPEQESTAANFLDKELRALLGLKAKEARGGRDFLAGLGEQTLLRLVEAGACDPLRLVREGLDVEAVIAAWRSEQDQFHLPGEVLTAADSAFYWGGAKRLKELGEAPEEANLDVWLWAVTQARHGSPFAAWLAQAYATIRTHAETSPLELSDYETNLRTVLGLPKLGKSTPKGHVDVVGGWTLTWNGYTCDVVWDPKQSPDWEADKHLAEALPPDHGHVRRLCTRLDLVTGTYDEIAADLLVEAPGHPKDPLASAPQVVAAAAQALGLEEDPARYWLQLLALSDPTDKHVEAWNGWTKAQRLAAAAPLLERGLLVEAKRARAGRTVFLPGGWQEATSPHLPMEVWKAPFYELIERPKVAPRLGVVVPLAPMRQLFEDAWHRYQDGDQPDYTELRTERYRRR